MNYFIVWTFLLAGAATGAAQVDSIVLPEPRTLDLPSLVSEALERNPTIRAAQEDITVMEARIPRMGMLAPPEFTYMREEMPGFALDKARVNRFELMQMLPFPTKLSAERAVGEIEAEHAYHEQLEIINDVVAQISSAYFELWFVQQRIVLERDNARLMKQVAGVSGARYAAGIVPQHDVLKAQMEIAMIGNTLIALRQQERAAKEMLMALLNRERADTLGFAVISEAIPDILPLDTLERLARVHRPMMMHDSMRIDEARLRLSLARQAFIPDLRLGLEYMTMPLEHMSGWSFSVGVTLPFAPWVVGRTRSQSEEAEAGIRKAAAAYEATKNMVLTDVRTRYLEAESERAQLASFQDVLIPQSQQTLESVLTSYQDGRTEFMMVLESYRSVTLVTVEYFMTRMKYEQSLAALQRAAGVRAVSELNEQEVNQ